MKNITNLFSALTEITKRPKPYEFYTAEELWNNEYTSEQMLMYHLNPDIDLSSRKTEFIEKSASWIANKFKLGAEKKVIDFGCGPGLYTTRFAKTGANVTGIDFSKRSIKYAKEQAEKEHLKINYIYQNYLEFDTDEKFDLITLIFCDFCPLSPEQRRTLLELFKKLLKPGGSLLMDVSSVEAFKAREESITLEKNWMNNFWSANDFYSILQTFKYESEKVSLDKHTIIEPDNIRTIYNWLQYFTPESIKEEINASGFQIADFYGNVAGADYDPKANDFALVAQPI